MSREKRALAYFTRTYIDSFHKLFGHPNFKIPNSELNKVIENIYSINENELQIYNYVMRAFFIESFLVDIYKIYKKNPRDYNKLIELEKDENNQLFFYSSINKYSELRSVWDIFISFPKLSFLSFNYYFSPTKKRKGTIYDNVIITDPIKLNKILEIRKKILSFLETYYPYPLIEIETIVEKTIVDKSTQTINEEKENIDLKSPFLNKMKEEQVWEKLFPKTNINRFDKKRIYDDFHKNYPGDDFYKYIKGFKDINPNYDWKKYIYQFSCHTFYTPPVLFPIHYC